MKRKILALLLAAAMIVCAFASCTTAGNGNENDEPTQDECNHTFSENWSSNADSHWHAATCEHGENKDSLAAHTDADEDGKCDVCAYEMGHEHTFAEEWSSDETKHWHAASCTHTTEKSDEALHADDDKNGECDVCSAHVHTLDDTGYCTGCNQQIEELNKNDISIVLAAIIAAYNKVVSGSVDYTNVIVGGSNITLSHKFEYTLATDGIYSKRTDSTSVTEIWSRLNGETVESVLVESNGDTVLNAEPNAASEDNLIGYYFAVSTLSDGYGAENILYNLYTLATTENSGNKVADLVVNLDAENNKGSFSYNILTINSDTAEGEPDNVNYYVVTVDFTYSAEFVLTELNVNCDCYTNSLDDESLNDYTYDQASQTITMKETATADTYTFAVTQIAGEKAALDMSGAEKYIPDSFELQVNGAPVTSLTLTPTFDSSNPWPDVALICPEGTFIKFVKSNLVISVYDKGTENNAKSKLGVYLVGDVLQVMPNGIPGEYTVVLTLGDFTASFEVIVEGANGDDAPKGEFTFTFTGTDNNTFYDQVYDFVAPESGTYTFYIPAGLGAYDKANFDAKTGSPYVDPTTSPNGGSFSVEIAKGKTYSFYIMVPVKGVAYTLSYDFSAHDVVVDDDDDNKDQGSGPVLNVGSNSVVFTADEIDAGSATKTITVSVSGRYCFESKDLFFNVKDSSGATLAKVEYKYLDLVAGETYTVEFSMFAMIGTKANTVYAFTVTAPAAEEEEEVKVAEGSYTGTDAWSNSPLTVIITADTITFIYAHPMTGTNEVTYTYAVEEGAVVIYDENGSVLNPLAGSLTIDEDGTPVSADYNGNSYTLSVAGEAAEGSIENPIAITLPAADLATEGNASSYLWYTFTTTEAGKITITYSNANSWVSLKNVNDAEDSISGYSKTTLTFKVKANSTYVLGLGVWDVEDGVTASVSFEVVEEAGLAEKGDMYVDNDATFEVTDADITAGGFTAILYTADAGEYSIYSNDLLVVSVVDENGNVISRNDNWYYELEAYSQYVVTFGTDYVSGAGEYSATVEYQYPEGHEMNPIWIYGLGDSITANYKGDYSAVWYTFYANANGTVTITTADEAALIMVKPVGGMDVTNNDEEGNWTSTVTITVMQGRQYLIGVIDANWSNEPQEFTFTPALTEGDYVGDGSQNTPAVIVDGANTANVPAWEVVYFVYTAANNGVLTLTTNSDNCSWAITTDFQEFEYVTDATLTISLEMDQKVYLLVSTVDGEEAAIEFNASFAADPVSVWYEDAVVTDGSSANTVVVEENTWVELFFQGNGQFVVTWDNASAKVDLISWGAPATAVANGGVVEGSMFFGVTLYVYFEDYAAGTVNVTVAPYVPEAGAELVIGNNTIEVQDTTMGDTYNLPVNEDEAVTYVITVGANGVVIVNGSDVYTQEGATVEITVPAGETVSIGIGALSWSDNVANVSVAVKENVVPGPGGAGGDNSNAPAASVTIAAPGNFKASGWQEFYTAENGGNYVITADGYDNIQKTYIQIKVNGGDTILVAKGAELENNMPYTITLNAGDVVTIQLYGWNDADKGTEITVNIAPAA